MSKVTWTRPSGSEIELASTPEMKAFAKANGFKRKRQTQVQPELKIGEDNGNSIAGSESHTSGNTGPGV